MSALRPAIEIRAMVVERFGQKMGEKLTTG
jgi:hypothetical protein